MFATVIRWTPALDWTGLGTILLALATTTLAWFTAQAARAALLEIEAGQRPVVLPLDLRSSEGEVELEIKNVGSGPALDVYALLWSGPVASGNPAGSSGWIPLGAGDRASLSLPQEQLGDATQWPMPMLLEIYYKDLGGAMWCTASQTFVTFPAPLGYPLSSRGDWLSTETLLGTGWTTNRITRRMHGKLIRRDRRIRRQDVFVGGTWTDGGANKEAAE